MQDGTVDVLADRYRLDALLGRGGAADVYRARDLVLDRDVAVKVLREAVDDTERSRFVGEAKMLARLCHVGLVTVLDVGVSGTQPFLVMEMVEGASLAAALRGGPLRVGQVAQIGAQLASAIAYAHGQGVVHRDVKPANVLLGPGGDAKLADFGIARLVGDTVRHTKTGTAIGTPAYVSPEQARGVLVGPPTDVYSLGLVLLEALTGERAFTGTPVETALARLQRPPAIPEDLPADWCDLLAGMTATDPADRPTATAAATRMQDFTTTPTATRVFEVTPGVPALAPTDLPTEPMDGATDTASNNPARIVAGVVVAALMVVALVAAGVVLGDGEGASEDDDPGPSATPTATAASTEPDEQDNATVTDGQKDETTGPADQNGQDSGGKDKGKSKDKNKGKGNGKKGKGGNKKGKG
jgi:eukaryotic-like serine/threonine-protein kinase